jgi:predicted RNA binding protein YcfA (HicA-like mRNA interferase family)
VTRLAGISGRKAIHAFERAGFVAGKPEGSHVTLRKTGFPIIVVPLHREVSPFLLRSQIKRAGLTEQQFLELL